MLRATFYIKGLLELQPKACYIATTRLFNYKQFRVHVSHMNIKPWELRWISITLKG